MVISFGSVYWDMLGSWLPSTGWPKIRFLFLLFHHWISSLLLLLTRPFWSSLPLAVNNQTSTSFVHFWCEALLNLFHFFLVSSVSLPKKHQALKNQRWVSKMGLWRLFFNGSKWTVFTFCVVFPFSITFCL